MNAEQKTVILVDDNMANLATGKAVLREHYNVIAAPSAEKMFVVLEKVKPALILLDVDMPVMNGYDAMKKLKADSRLAGIPVIFLTALDDKESRAGGLQLGAADFITKPFTAELLRDRVANALAATGQA